MTVLGLSAFYHDAAACIIKDGKVIAAVEEERMTGIKHDSSFPFYAIGEVLNIADINLDEIDKVAWYEDPKVKEDRVRKTFNKHFFKTLALRYKFIKRHKEEGNIEEVLRTNLNWDKPVVYVPHHLSHAALSYYTSPYKEAAIVTIDGVGEWETLTISKGKGKDITKVYSQNFPHSLGMFYSTMTAYLGFKPNEGEYKVMGLAPYGNYLKYYSKLLSIFRFNTPDIFTIDQKYFTWEYSDRKMFNRKLHKLLELLPRLPEEEVTQDHKDLAAALQKVYETVFFKILHAANNRTGSTNLCLGGGCAYNGVANSTAYRLFDSLHVPFAPSDAGSAIGAAMFVSKTKTQVSPYLGQEDSDEEIEKELKQWTTHIKYTKLSESTLLKRTAHLIHSGNVIGWYQGRMEFGARALGNRSILASPLQKDMKARINKVIKKREGFRPFAPSCIEEHAYRYFEIKEPVPYMNQVTQVKKVNNIHKMLPAITHIDNSARVQTVTRKQNRKYYKLLTELFKISGFAMVLNTSFNFKDQTITATPYDAIRRFLSCEMDYLVIGNYIVEKNEKNSILV